MMLCSSCWKSVCECGDNCYVEIDDEMVEIVINLNQRGYYTRNCCAGHVNRSSQPLTTYVQFQKIYDFDTIPVGFSLEKQETIDGIVNNVIRSVSLDGNQRDGFYAKLNDVIINQHELESERRLYIQELKKWTLNLPTNRKIVLNNSITTNRGNE